MGGGYPHFLSILAATIEEGLVVELGSRYGISTLAIAAGLRPSAEFAAVDILRDLRYVPQQILGMPNFKFLECDGLNVPAIYRSLSHEKTVDILFSDTEHTYEQISAEFRVWEPMLSENALFIIDDINLNDKRRFFEEYEGEKLDLTVECHTSGFGVLVVNRKRERGLQSFAERLSESAERALGFYSERHVAALRDQIRNANATAEAGVLRRGRPKTGLIKSGLRRIARYCGI